MGRYWRHIALTTVELELSDYQETAIIFMCILHKSPNFPDSEVYDIPNRGMLEENNFPHGL